MKKYILALDQGTTGSRAIIFDKKGRNVISSYHEFPQYFPRPGWVEHEPEEIWQSVKKSIEKVLKKIDPQDIAAIGITNQRETTILWDKKTGKPVYRAIVWQCRRTAQRCQNLSAQQGMTKLIRSRTGLPIDAYFSATKIEWILKNVKAARQLALKKQLCFGTTDSWVLWKLSGGEAHATDYTNASRTMLFNLAQKKWDQELLKIFKIPEGILPRVCPSSGIFGKTKHIGRLPAGIPIAGLAGDQQAALFGQTCFTAGEIKNTYGTGCFVLLNTGQKRINSRYGLITTLGCNALGKPAYVLEGAVFIAGAAIQWLRDQLHIISQAKDSEKSALSIKDTGGVYFVPAFVGLGAPYWDSLARGAITGITRGTRCSHLVRAALEAMAYQTRDVMDSMQKDAGLKIKALKVDGGAAANNFLCQFQADILGIPVIRPRIIESTSLGAAYLAGLAIGFWKSGEQIKKFWAQERIFKPRMKRSTALKLYSGWQTAVSKTLSTS